MLPSRSDCILNKTNAEWCISREDIGDIIGTVDSKTNQKVNEAKKENMTQRQ